MAISNFSNQASCFNLFFYARNTLGALTPPSTTTMPTIATYSPFGPLENFADGFLQTRAYLSAYDYRTVIRMPKVEIRKHCSCSQLFPENTKSNCSMLTWKLMCLMNRSLRCKLGKVHILHKLSHQVEAELFAQRNIIKK
jgi:hypothetical protein